MEERLRLCSDDKMSRDMQISECRADIEAKKIQVTKQGISGDEGRRIKMAKAEVPFTFTLIA